MQCSAKDFRSGGRLSTELRVCGSFLSKGSRANSWTIKHCHKTDKKAVCQTECIALSTVHDLQETCNVCHTVGKLCCPVSRLMSVIHALATGFEQPVVLSSKKPEEDYRVPRIFLLHC